MIELLAKYPMMGTIIGIVLGFILTQIGVSYRARLENKKTLKTVLFHLLETYHSLDRSSPGRRLGILFRKVMDMMPGVPFDEATLGQVEQQYAPLLQSLLAEHMAPKIQEIYKDYQKSVQVLSAIAPFTAYYLSRRSSIEELFQSFSGFAEQMAVQSSPEDGEVRRGAERIINSMKPKIFEDSLIGLEADIRTVAWKIGVFSWIRAQLALARIKNSVVKGVDRDFEQFMKELMPQFVDAIQASQPRTAI